MNEDQIAPNTTQLYTTEQILLDRIATALERLVNLMVEDMENEKAEEANPNLQPTGIIRSLSEYTEDELKNKIYSLRSEIALMDNTRGTVQRRVHLSEAIVEYNAELARRGLAKI